jgi:sigma-B regulation protein RsbU (phosphoserine phosphatase)
LINPVPTASAPTTKVLIAEDDTMPSKVLARALESWGYEVFAAPDGAAGWELFQQHPITLVVSDWEMPVANGIDLCRKVRSLKDRDYAYFVLLTSRSDKTSLVEALEAGADDFIGKPFDEGELHARIRAGERILRLSHELARRLDQLGKANDCNRKLNLQLARDMKSLVSAISHWSQRDADGDTADKREIRMEMRMELNQVIEDWMSSLAATGHGIAL